MRTITWNGGDILFHDNTYYWFGEHKIEGPAGNKAYVGFHCYSSKDLYNWEDESITLAVVKNDPGHPLTEGRIIERPMVIYNKKTKKWGVKIKHQGKHKHISYFDDEIVAAKTYDRAAEKYHGEFAGLNFK